MNKFTMSLIFNAIALGVGVATLVLSLLNQIDNVKQVISLLSIAVICLSLSKFDKNTIN
ncbi:hypothetical protein [Clostridium frigidicarnis]|uniref:Uncharacterized protein n=1 Tax=Clostridium frigidicarnis TaxID=84698 RepID=A0A1I0XT82_9CLOT|nr:hypothetical protein [Clostridium frigidicarnis]SFB03388.1 hypothetical protein SAMN04488528_100996 [Clostridium frigidicarnis]